MRKDNFNRALVLMHRTLGGPESMVPPPPPQMMVNQPVAMDMQMVPPPAQLEFKELVSQKCAERGIMFVPMPGRREAGKQVSILNPILIAITHYTPFVRLGVSCR